MQRSLTSIGLCLVVLVVAGCGAAPPRIALAEAELAEGPVLIREGDGYVLRYRFEPSREHAMRFAMTPQARRTADAGYYYFAGALQSTVVERGHAVELPLARDGLDDLAAAGRVFWLDPDGTTHPIPVVDRAP